MSLLKRLGATPEATSIKPTSPEKKEVHIKTINHIMLPADNTNQELKEKIHRRLIDKLDLTSIDNLPPGQLKRQVREVVEELLLDFRYSGKYS